MTNQNQTNMKDKKKYLPTYTDLKLVAMESQKLFFWMEGGGGTQLHKFLCLWTYMHLDRCTPQEHQYRPQTTKTAQKLLEVEMSQTDCVSVSLRLWPEIAGSSGVTIVNVKQCKTTIKIHSSSNINVTLQRESLTGQTSG